MKIQHWKTYLLMLALVALPLVGCGGDTEMDDTEVADATATEPADTGTEMAQDVPGPAGDAEQLAAMAMMETADGQSIGEVRFYRENGQVRIVAELEGVDGPGMHGIHIHENGECQAPDFKSAGGHFNPAGVEHACPPTSPRHAGDLGNLEVAQDGTASYELTTDLVNLEAGATDSIIGKAVILHTGQDDCQTQPTGDAGSRQACGLIALSNPAAQDTMTVEPEGDMEDGGMEDGGEAM